MSAKTKTLEGQGFALGLSVPPFTPHAISVSLPKWDDNVGYEMGEKRVVDAMVSGYPRFFIHLSIEKLARICEHKFGISGERCLLFPAKIVADYCRSFLVKRLPQGESLTPVRLTQYLICRENMGIEGDIASCNNSPATSSLHSTELHIVFFPPDAMSLAKQFWQHTGMGISSRLAEHCLSMITGEPVRTSSPTFCRLIRGRNKHYAAKIPSRPPSPTEDMSKDQSLYLEERYGRNLPVRSAAAAKRALRRRIAGVLVHDNTEECSGVPLAGGHDIEIGPSSRGITNVTEDDVYLYPTGMSAIWNAHHLALMTRPPAKSVCFGFPYTDTLKILQKWGPGCYFLGHGLDTDIDELEKILAQETSTFPLIPPVLALFTEFPSNPLLRSADLPRLRALADKYDFLIVVDETLGNFANVEVLPYADMLVSSLSKIFSGDANVMGGSLVLNPVGRHYEKLKGHLASSYEDLYFDEDAIYMERNSRNFKRRIGIIDDNTEAVCDFLHSHSVSGGATSSVIKDVFYPKWMTRDKYDLCRIKDRNPDAENSRKEGGFGGLFSVTFTTAAASSAFFDSMSCFKGPSLGTNFTLACPYTILAHFLELEWAAKYGVEETLVRVSVGMEDRESLLRCFESAWKAAEATSTLDSR